ncbi:MAG: helicase-exonuclease AddAB subunit AddA, partial [Clostridiaceae bacterium]|nr:helicase-exonuclease AddAB subunit AddA [Clostridiaceae bacterium]
CEARVVAKRLLELMKPDEDGKYYGVFDKSKKKYRKIEFRDIVILLRTTKNWADVFADELAALGIPAFADTGSGFFKTIEVQVILSLLQIIDNPLQDIPLLSVLRSPIYAFTTEELSEIRMAKRKVPIYYALLEYSKGEEEGCKKAKGFVEKLSEWRKLAYYLPSDELIWRLYNETGYYTFVGAMPQGEQRQANLRVLFERARQFEETSYKGLFNFINFIDKLKSSKGDMGSAKILSENDNVVRIMSIHKSKGLEFPVVFLSGCGKKFNLQDMNRSILFHQELGFGPDMVDLDMRISYPSAAKLAIKEKIKSETLSEEMRILYVALTRAREKLIITGSCRDLSKALKNWAETASAETYKLPDYEMVKANNFLDWIVPPILRHKDSNIREGLIDDENFSGFLVEDSSNWDVKLWNKNDVLSSAMLDVKNDDNLINWLNNKESDNPVDNISDDVLSNEVERRLSWEYPYIWVSDIPAKISVTELKRYIKDPMDDDAVSYFQPALIKKPMYLEEEKGLSNAMRGTILHFIMQHLHLERIAGIYKMGYDKNNLLLDEVQYQIEKMVSKELLTRQQAESIEAMKIVEFFNSSLGQRLLLSQNVNREVPFNMEVSCNELYKNLPDTVCKNEAILLQGIIDCYFEEDDGIVLIDYKTDYVKKGREHLIKENYRNQIEFYTRALESMANKRVKERYIYLFYNGSLLAF